MPRTQSLSPLLASTAVLVLAVVLAACTRGPSQDAAAINPAPAVPPALDQPREDVPPATASELASPPIDAGAAHFNGYANARFGMTPDEVAQAWQGKLNEPPKQDDGAQVDGVQQPCYYLSPIDNPSPAHFALMIENGKFVRYSVSNDDDVAPGGGKVGMDTAQIEALYPGRIASSPHKYVEGGNYLRIKADDGSNGVLVFEANADGKVTQWRVGEPPAVDYVEGCS